MAAALRSTVTRRQVHITMVPAPRNVGQSRLVLKELQKFGEIATFLNLKYDYRAKAVNSGRCAFAIFETTQAASDAINASPVKVALRQLNSPFSSAGPNAQPSSEPRSTEPPADTEIEPDTITCTINPSDHDHNVTVRQNPYHQAFHLSKSWFEVQDLVRADGPLSTPLVEYADCFTRRKGWVPYRVRDKKLQENAEAGATNLTKLWKRGLEKERVERMGFEEKGKNLPGSGTGLVRRIW